MIVPNSALHNRRPVPATDLSVPEISQAIFFLHRRVCKSFPLRAALILCCRGRSVPIEARKHPNTRIVRYQDAAA